VIFSFKLLMFCSICGGVYLVIVDLIWSRFESLIPTFRNFPKELVEPKNFGWFTSMPAVVYDRFYTVMPFSGIRGGVAIALFLFMFGMVPLAILLMFRIRIPAVYMRVVGALAIIGYLYSL